MRKFLRIIALLLAMVLCFLAGWRVMPRIWPEIKPTVVSVLNLPTPTPAPTQEPYLPEGTAQLGDAIAADDSLVYYFYRETCPFCRVIDGLTSGLPEEITLPDGSKSAVRLVTLNKSDEAEMAVIQQFYDSYPVPEERQLVPSLIIGDRYIMGTEEMHLFLNALLSGEGLDTPLLDGNARVE